MTSPANKKAALRSIGESVDDSDIDRLLNASRTAGRGKPVVRPKGASRDDFAARLDLHRSGGVVQRNPIGNEYEVYDDDELPPYPVVEAPSITMWNIPVFVLYACLGVFTRIWTDVTLYFDFGDDRGFKLFAIAVSMGLHAFIFAIVINAWRANWELRTRNFLALAALAGYLGFRTLTQL